MLVIKVRQTEDKEKNIFDFLDACMQIGVPSITKAAQEATEHGISEARRFALYIDDIEPDYELIVGIVKVIYQLHMQRFQKCDFWVEWKTDDEIIERDDWVVWSIMEGEILYECVTTPWHYLKGLDKEWE